MTRVGRRGAREDLCLSWPPAAMSAGVRPCASAAPAGALRPQEVRLTAADLYVHHTWPGCRRTRLQVTIVRCHSRGPVLPLLPFASCLWD
jgi:hypothetical protein